MDDSDDVRPVDAGGESQVMAQVALAWDAIASEEWDELRGLLAPEFRHRINRQLDHSDFDVDDSIVNTRVWKELAGPTIESIVVEVLATSDSAVLYRRELRAVNEEGTETTWPAIVVAAARDERLTHFEEFEPSEEAAAMLRFKELNQ